MSRNNHEQDIKDRLRLAVKVTIAIITVAVLSMCQIIVITALTALDKAACTGEKTGITTIIAAAVLLTVCIVGITAVLNINKRL